MQFWRDEYELNALIKNFPKPYVAMMHGFIMGGGVGVSAHGSHRIVTDNSIISMPETGIGFLPDVGGTYLLSRAPDGLGHYYGLTGGRMSADDAIYCGFADHYVPEDRFSALKEAILAGGNVDELIQANAATPPEGDARWHHTQITDWFAGKSFDEAFAAIEADDSEFGQKTHKVLLRQCPLSVKSTFWAINAAKDLPNIEECLGQEFRYADASLYEVNFYEGIRAAIIEKDRNPQWVPATLDQVTEQMVEAMFKPLGEKELKLS
jgi:enoyl-CoA hydratase